ncbi:hypothetical protein F2P79_009198 [Pimephales promelas]|nr:hypothetical protein F2P79_009198 [Pimephales promelas]
MHVIVGTRFQSTGGEHHACPGQQWMKLNLKLRGQIRQLQADNGRLRQQPPPPPQLDNSANPANPVSNERLIYLPRERKCPEFRGRVGIDIVEWVEEVEVCARTRHLGALDKAYFMFDHLDGEAKDEIRYRPKADRENPERIADILKELYGCSQSYVALQESFFSRKQLDGESLQEYSHALFSLMEKVKQVSLDSVPQFDMLLRDQFAEHVIDSDLRRELKRLVRQTPGMSMLEVRAAAIRWECEGRPSDFNRVLQNSARPSPIARQYSKFRNGRAAVHAAEAKGTDQSLN